MKRSKNIFNSPIAHESLMEEEGNRQFMIGNKNIDSNWLSGIKEGQYRQYIASALALTDLQKQLDDLKQQQSKENKRSNIFKISRTRKKLDGLDLVQIQEEKHIQQSLTKNEPPQSDQFIVQKMTGGFFKNLLERKCQIRDKQFYIETLKDEKTKWNPINIEKYNIELEDKQKPLDRDAFKQFTWLNDYKQRLLLWSEEQESKCYCVYGKENDLKKFQRYFQVENLQVKQLSVFQSLDTQFKQKIVTLFGNKVRFYDHLTKIRRAEKDTQYDAIKKIMALNQQKKQKQMQKIIENKQKQKQNEPENDHSSEISQSGLLDAKNKERIKHSEQIHQSLISLDDSKNTKSKISDKQKKPENSIFKLNLKKSMVFYDQLQEPLDFDNKEGFSIQDINLNLKEEVGVSQVDEQSSYRSSSMYDKQKRITKMTVQNAWDESQKFKINIFEVSSVDGQNNPSQFNPPAPEARSTESLQLFTGHHNEDDEEFKRQNSLKISQIGHHRKGARKLHRQSSDIDSQVLQYFQLQKARPSDDSESFDSQKSILGLQTVKKQQKQSYLIKNFKKKKIDELDIILRQKPQEIYLAVTEIFMMNPYHQEKLEFQILQLDTQLQMQNKIVACSMVEGCMKQTKNNNAQKHMHYACEDGLFFRMSRCSPFLVFVLQEASKCHYMNFQIDPNPKYQRNQSQLLITHLDKDGYIFSIGLVLYTSPTPINLKPSLKTVQFMKQYLASEDYNFKHDFIDDKKRLHQIKQKWNKLQNKHIVKETDAQTFAKTVFLGLPESIFNQIKSKVTYNPKRLFNFNQNESRLIEDNVLANFYQIKSFTKPCLFVNAISKVYFNQCFRERLQQVYVYFLQRYGSVRNLALIFIKVILDKLESILILCRRQEQIQAVINLYAEVEYQIDQVFTQVSKYFKK